MYKFILKSLLITLSLHTAHLKAESLEQAELVNEVHNKLNQFYGAGECNLRKIYDDWNGIDYIDMKNGIRLYTVLCDRGYISDYIWLKSTPVSAVSENGNQISYTHYEPVYFPFPRDLDENIKDTGVIFISNYQLDHRFRQNGESTPKENFDPQSNTISSTYCNNNHCEFATKFTWQYTAANGFILTKIDMDTEPGYSDGYNVSLTPAFIDKNIIGE